MKRNLNLFPAMIRRQLLMRKRLKQWGAAWVCLATVILAYYGWHLTLFSTGRQEMSVWERRASATSLVEEKCRVLRKQIERLNERLTKYGHLESEQVGFQLLATISQCSSSCQHDIQVQKMAFKHAQVPDTSVPAEPPSNPPKPPRMREVRKLVLSGVANNNLAIAQFVASLRDSGAFQSVDLKSSQGNKLADAGLRSYHVECSF